MKTIIDYENVSKNYHSHIILDNVSFTINKGDIVGFVGLNGAGKTTIFKTMLGLQKIKNGKISLFNKDVNNKEVFQYIGALIESPNFYNNMSGYQNLMLLARVFNVSKEEVLSLIKRYDMDKYIYKKVSSYSLGMIQKLGIVKTLINNPKLLVLDEPTNGLDPININQFIDLINNLKQNKTTILISSHNVDLLKKICNRVIFINKGKLILDMKINCNTDLELMLKERMK